MQLSLKQYQSDALIALNDFCVRIKQLNDASAVSGRLVDNRFIGSLDAAQLNTAFEATVTANEPAIANGALRAKPYNDIVKGVPSACLRIPTGGGKTLLGAHAIATVASAFQEKSNPFVIWLVHSDAILQQTLGALSQHQHPYRQALDSYYDGRVKVCSMESLSQVAAADFYTHTVVLVATIQSFRIETDKQHMRTVYSFDEAYGNHFEAIPAAYAPYLLTVTSEDVNLTKESPLREADIGTIKHCVANLLRLQRPIVIVDEAHNFYSDKSVQTIADFWPCAVVELTATPKENCSNVVYSVSALALKSEHMIKLPIVLANHDTWQTAVDDALLTQARLETLAAGESPDYIRPIILFQAESKDQAVTVEVLKAYLLNERRINPDWVVVHTGDEKGLTSHQLFDAHCPVRCVITVKALAEGWDCSLAYILCSVRNVGNSKDVEQLLGRVLRMPYARQRKNAELNKAYAHIVSEKFSNAVDGLRDKMVEKLGFNKSDLATAFVAAQPNLQGLGDLAQPLPTALRGLHTSTFELPTPPMIGALPASQAQRVVLHNTAQGTQMQVYGLITEPMREMLTADVGSAKEIKAVNERINLHNHIAQAQSSPAQRGEVFAQVPQLCLPLDGGKLRWEVVEPELLQTLGEWDLPTAHVQLDAYIPTDSTEAQLLDMDDKKERLIGKSFNYQQLNLNSVKTTVLESDLLQWLDRQLQVNDDLMQDQTLAYAGAVLRHLQVARKLPLTQLERDKVRLVNAMHAQIARLRGAAEQSQFGLAFDEMRNSATLESAFQYAFSYQAGVYPARNVFDGDWSFEKNYFDCVHDLSFKTKAGAFSEEFTCLRAIDEHVLVKQWVRNIELQPKYSFWLPTSKDKFYPDFVAQLTDGRVLVVEYKGAHLDEPHKKDVGELWERTSGGRCLFLWAVKQDAAGRNVSGQLAAKLAS